MSKMGCLLLQAVVLIATLGFMMGSVFAQGIFSDNFNAYSDGSLAGQGGWVQQLGPFNVQGVTVYEGAKAVFVNSDGSNHRVYKDGTSRSSGVQRFFMRQNSTANAEFQVLFYEGETPAGYVQFLGGNIILGWGDQMTPTPLAPTQANTWHQIDFEWRDSPSKQIRARVDGGTYSAWSTPINVWSSGLNRIKLFVGNGATSGVGCYVDTITNLPPLPTLGLTLTGCTTCQAGSTFIVTATVKNPTTTPVNVEVKAGVVLPDGTLVNVWTVADKHYTVQLAAGLDTTVEIFRVQVPAGLPKGAWSYEAALIDPELGRTLARDTKAFIMQ